MIREKITSLVTCLVLSGLLSMLMGGCGGFELDAGQQGPLFSGGKAEGAQLTRSEEIGILMVVREGMIEAIRTQVSPAVVDRIMALRANGPLPGCIRELLEVEGIDQDVVRKLLAIAKNFGFDPKCGSQGEWRQEILTSDVIITPHSSVSHLLCVKEVHGSVKVDTMLSTDPSSLMTELFPLHRLEKITGSLTISSSHLKRTGLSSLQEVGKNVWISENPRLESLADLGSLERVKGDFTIWGENQLEDLSGLSGLVEVGGKLKVNFSKHLVTLGFQSLERVGSLEFMGNSKLTSIQGLERLQAIQGDLLIANHDSLRSIHAFGQLKQIGGNLDIEGNMLLDLDRGMSSLEEVGKNLIINQNATLTTLGFDALTRVGWEVDPYHDGGIARIQIAGNRSLSQVVASEFVGRLVAGGFSGEVWVKGNMEWE